MSVTISFLPIWQKAVDDLNAYELFVECYSRSMIESDRRICDWLINEKDYQDFEFKQVETNYYKVVGIFSDELAIEFKMLFPEEYEFLSKPYTLLVS